MKPKWMNKMVNQVPDRLDGIGTTLRLHKNLKLQSGENGTSKTPIRVCWVEHVVNKNGL